MRVLNLGLAALRTVQALDYPKYLAATWVMATEMGRLYGDRNRADGRDLSQRSLSVLRAAIDAPIHEVQATARDLFFEWLDLMGIEYEPEDPDDVSEVDVDVEPGVLNLWFTIRDVMAELAAEAPPYSGISRLTLAVEMFEETDSDRGVIVINTWEVTEDSFTATTLAKFHTVAELVQQGNLAPEAVRAEAFGW
ncbi:hypothetical protein [Hamadaea tsunoensis]|uniref:hypothetical protein n=1 Tax=Hamadaea tsunoensis TaxID=53368 RepID=UPI0012F9D786|nr:hypothetical protein [Hamadaea tsunoensis]